MSNDLQSKRCSHQLYVLVRPICHYHHVISVPPVRVTAISEAQLDSFTMALLALGHSCSLTVFTDLVCTSKLSIAVFSCHMQEYLPPLSQINTDSEGDAFTQIKPAIRFSGVHSGVCIVVRMQIQLDSCTNSHWSFYADSKDSMPWNELTQRLQKNEVFKHNGLLNCSKALQSKYYSNY